jgi:hypothetical protein
LQINDLCNLSFRCRANFAKGAKIKKIKNQKIPCVFAVLWYSLSMKEKAPQKAQLWAVGNKVYRVIRNEGDKTHVHHHGQMALFYTRHLKMATPSQVAEYLGK